METKFKNMTSEHHARANEYSRNCYGKVAARQN